MNTDKISIKNCALIWFGAGVSIAEIITGTYIAPLGLKKGIAAIILGHLIGGILLFFAGYIGAISKKSSMETTKFSFGVFGAKFFALLNVIQLAGWTGIMIYDGAISINNIFKNSVALWAVIIGILIIVWILVGIQNLSKLNAITMSLLFILTLVLCKIIFFSNQIVDGVLIEEQITFGSAVELAVAMPLSWLPLISDYTKDVEKPFKATFVSALTYTIISSWMYIIGMGSAIFTQETDIASILLKAGLGVVGLIIVVLSTVTTTFLDAFSAGVSSQTIFSKIPVKIFSVAITILGTLGAILFNMDNITDFLYLIGSVFAPMIAILMADFFVVKLDASQKILNIPNILIWLGGFILYRFLISMEIDFLLGYTIVTMLIIFTIATIVGLINKRFFISRESN